MIPVIDLFAGPGGLCEGFSQPVNGLRPFQPVLSIEMDPVAHKTLLLRAFVHHFMRTGQEIPAAYYEYVAGVIDREVLFGQYKDAAEEAGRVAWCAELGGTRVSKNEFDERIRNALNGSRDWLLIGGPPCQAYSLAGRSRSVGGIKNKENLTWEQAELEFNKDRRQRLYRQYLRIIAVHAPSVFVMENVAGMLSARVDGSPVFPKIMEDLKDPGKVAGKYFPGTARCRYRYRIYSFVTGKEELPEDGERYLIRAERYGVPQCRHRVILLGVREDYCSKGLIVDKLNTVDKSATVLGAISDLPKLKSTISKLRKEDTLREVLGVIDHFVNGEDSAEIDSETRASLMRALRRMRGEDDGSYLDPHEVMSSLPLYGWYSDPRLAVPLNHESRSHMRSDLCRYSFVAAYGEAHKKSPVISDFPVKLLPAHSNIDKKGKNKSCDFADRFKVQLWGRPSSTVTSHIAKDGHYFIHPDVAQCRSLTVREAARLQTFPDNYYFEGNRTQQYHQVGNAVPPYLANQIAKIVYGLFLQIAEQSVSKL